MRATIRSTLKSTLRAVAMLSCGLAVAAFLFGGGLIHALDPKTDRVLAEMEGLGLMMLFGAVAAFAHFTAERLDEADDGGTSKSLGEALRK